MIYVWHHAVTLVLALGAAGWLVRARWVDRCPRMAVLLWQATAFSVLSAAVGVLLSAGLAPYRRGIVPALGQLTSDIAAGAVPPGLTPVHVLAAVTGLLLAGAALVAQASSSWEVHRHRARHRLLLRLVARPDGHDGALVLDHPAAAAYYLPGRPGCTVVSSGALDTLTADEVAAVLAHERAHARERHHLVLAPFHALHRAAPCRVTARVGACVELLVEMRADDRAARDGGAAALIAALRRFRRAGAPAAPRGALAAADLALALRVERLRAGRRPLRPHVRWALGVVALTVAATPASLFVLPG